MARTAQRQFSNHPPSFRTHCSRADACVYCRARIHVHTAWCTTPAGRCGTKTTTRACFVVARFPSVCIPFLRCGIAYGFSCVRRRATCVCNYSCNLAVRALRDGVEIHTHTFSLSLSLYLVLPIALRLLVLLHPHNLCCSSVTLKLNATQSAKVCCVRSSIQRIVSMCALQCECV